MKKIQITFLAVVFALTAFSQREIIVEKEKLETIVKGEHKNKLVTPNSEPEISSIAYQYYGLPSFPYQHKVNELIYNYVKEVAIDTAYIPIAGNISLQFFKDAVNNFFESYNHTRFVLNVDDLLPYSLDTKIVIDTTSLKNYVVIHGESTLFTGGAHHNYYMMYKVVDKRTAEVVTWDNLIKNKEKFMAIAEKRFRKVENMGKDADYSTHFFLRHKFELSRQFIFEKKKLQLIYLPYEAREWSRGFIHVDLPKGKIKKHINFNW